MSISIDDTLTAALGPRAPRQQRQHSRQTLEHFLYVIVRDGSASNLFKACGCDAMHLRAELVEYLEFQPERPGFRTGAAKMD